MLNVLSDEVSNTIVSPYSAFSTLLMVASIFKKSTRNQILEAFKMRGDIIVEALLTSLRNMIQTIENETPNGIVKGANTIWPNSNLAFNMDIYKHLVEFLGAEITPIRFPQPSSLEINRKVEETTHGLIKDILSPSDVPEWTSSVFTNALYFNSKWAHPFKSTSTSSYTFTLLDGTTKLTKYMHKKSYFLYAEDFAAQVLQMHYANDFSMVVILPKKNDLSSRARLATTRSTKRISTCSRRGKSKSRFRSSSTHGARNRCARCSSRWGLRTPSTRGSRRGA